MKSNWNHFEFLVFNFKLKKLWLQNLKFPFVLLTLFLVSVSTNRAQQNITAGATDFSSVEYYDAPHQQQIKSRLSGAEAQPQPGGLLLIKQLKLEMFDVKGRPEIIVSAPECIYDTMKGIAASSGRLQVRTGDGKFRIQGDGFLWRQNNSFLTISNHVQTIIENAARIAP